MQSRMLSWIYVAYICAALLSTSSMVLAAKLTPMNPNRPIDEITRYPTGLNCPSNDTGELEFSLATKKKLTAIVRVNYKAGKLLSFSVSTNESGKFEVQMTNESSDEFRTTKVWVQDLAALILKDVCHSEENKRKYDDLSATNRAILDGQLIEE